ncbi:hypothetical protein [Legionella fallonii]|uniref:Uncharacterized protein n=1 Tax=Legionella fallonii LLAP-10 TaxID=1212491 RepID=A0A098G229_9GAMM|nr:hypothetical protein [Legionella fallonii]CEG55550.1 conserved protein of unknown function [Legionella fallonii LLAP-10]
MPGFFSTVNSRWQDYSALREKYADAVPVPQASYFKPLRSIDAAATCVIRPIEKPLYLAFNTLGFLIKAILDLALSIILAPCALVLTVFAPNSDVKRETNAAFGLAAASTLVDLGMTAVALFSTVMALFFNPLNLVTRTAATLVDGINSATESCCGLTIARL